MRNHLISRIAAPGRRLAVFWGGSAGSSPSTASKPAALTQRQKAKYVDLRGIDDPLTALYWSRGEPIVIDVPLGNILNLGPLAFDCSNRERKVGFTVVDEGRETGSAKRFPCCRRSRPKRRVHKHC